MGISLQTFIGSDPAGVSIMGPVGGTGGRAFTDATPPAHMEVGKIDIWAGSHIDAIQLTYRDKGSKQFQSGVKHGGRGGQMVFSHVLQPNEHIVSFTGKHGSVIDSLAIQTNLGTFLRVGGNGGSNEYALQVPQSPTIYELVGVFGAAGDVIDRIGILCRQRID